MLWRIVLNFKMKKLIKKISFILLLTTSFMGFSQTPGFNYQALILDNDEVQIPGTDVSNVKPPLSSKNIILRFTITNETEVEYIEEHNIITDENGMISVIIGDGEAYEYSFKNINWDGKLKYLNVELNVLNNDDGFIFLDTQKILYVPHPSSVSKTTLIINAKDGQLEFTAPFNITNPNKISVYRNGILINFTTINNKTIRIESEAICYEKDEIKIVQFF